MARDEQGKLRPAYLYPLEQMGHIPMPQELPHWMMLNSSFITDKDLPTSDYCAETKTLSNVNCPFCKKGVLRLVKAEPIYSGGACHRPSTLHHVGDELEYDCSNDGCDAKFEGKSQWMWID